MLDTTAIDGKITSISTWNRSPHLSGFPPYIQYISKHHVEEKKHEGEQYIGFCNRKCYPHHRWVKATYYAYLNFVSRNLLSRIFKYRMNHSCLTRFVIFGTRAEKIKGYNQFKAAERVVKKILQPRHCQ